MNFRNIKHIVSILIIPIIIVLWLIVFKAQKPALMCIIISILSCVPFFASFEKNDNANWFCCKNILGFIITLLMI